MSLRALLQVSLLVTLALLSACASAPTPQKNAQTYYEEGEAAFRAKNYEDAVTLLKKVKESYSSPQLSTKAELKIADAHFANKSYIEAAAAYEEFRKLHPTHEKAPYALYRQGLSNYMQITGIDTDQTPVKNAVICFESFLAQYPKSEYVPEVRKKLEDCRSKQLQYEIYVGNFYLRTGKYRSAIKRLTEALQRFPHLPEQEQALLYLGKAYLKSGDKAKSAETFKRLFAEYPQGRYAEEARQLSGR